MRCLSRVDASSPHHRPPALKTGPDDSGHESSNSSRDAYSAIPHEIGTSTWSRDVHSDCSAAMVNLNITGSRQSSTSSDRSTSNNSVNAKYKKENKRDNRAKTTSADESKIGTTSDGNRSIQFPALEPSTKRDDAETSGRGESAKSGFVIHRYREPAVLGKGPQPAGGSRRVVLARQHWVHEIQHEGHRSSLAKHAERGTPNRWRRYAPIALIHERGGWVNGGGVDGHSGRKDDYRYIQPGTPMSQPSPGDTVFSTSTDVGHEDCAPTLLVPPKCRDSADAAYALALQLSTQVEQMWREFRNAHQSVTPQKSRRDGATVQLSNTTSTFDNVVKAVRDAPRRIFDVLSSPLRSAPTPSPVTNRNRTIGKERQPAANKTNRRNRRLPGPSWECSGASPSDASPSFC